MNFTQRICVTERKHYILNALFGTPLMGTTKTNHDSEAYCNISRSDTPLMEIYTQQRQIIVVKHVVILAEVHATNGNLCTTKTNHYCEAYCSISAVNTPLIPREQAKQRAAVPQL
jgi:hypothetical protein